MKSENSNGNSGTMETPISVPIKAPIKPIKLI